MVGNLDFSLFTLHFSLLISNQKTQISDIFSQRIARIIRIFRRKRRRWPDAEQSEWQEPPRLKNPYNPCNPLWKNTSET